VWRVSVRVEVCYVKGECESGRVRVHEGVVGECESGSVRVRHMEGECESGSVRVRRVGCGCGSVRVCGKCACMHIWCVSGSASVEGVRGVAIGKDGPAQYIHIPRTVVCYQLCREW